MKLLSSILAISALLGNSAMAAEISIFKNGKIISSSKVNIQGASNGSASTTVRSILIDSISGEIGVILSTDYGIDKRVNNAFRYFSCKQNTAILTQTVTFNGGTFDEVNDAVSKMFQTDFDVLAGTRRTSTVTNSNELVRFNELANSPTIAQAFKNICNYNYKN
jgi:hypothetical protein